MNVEAALVVLEDDEDRGALAVGLGGDLAGRLARSRDRRRRRPSASRRPRSTCRRRAGRPRRRRARRGATIDDRRDGSATSRRPQWILPTTIVMSSLRGVSPKNVAGVARRSRRASRRRRARRRGAPRRGTASRRTPRRSAFSHSTMPSVYQTRTSPGASSVVFASYFDVAIVAEAVAADHQRAELALAVSPARNRYGKLWPALAYVIVRVFGVDDRREARHHEPALRALEDRVVHDLEQRASP